MHLHEPESAIRIRVVFLNLSIIAIVLYVQQWKKGLLEKCIIFKGKKEIQMDLEKFTDFHSKGKMTVRHVRCIIMGCSGAGKTTLLRRLQNANLKDLKKVKTTELVDVHVNIFNVLENGNTIQSKVVFFIDDRNNHRRYFSEAAMLVVSMPK